MNFSSKDTSTKCVCIYVAIYLKKLLHIYIERDKIISQYTFDKTREIYTHDGRILKYNMDWQSYRPHRTIYIRRYVW